MRTPATWSCPIVHAGDSRERKHPDPQHPHQCAAHISALRCEKNRYRHGCVRPGILPASMSVAPNSPNARANAKTVPAMIPGQASGSRTRRKVRHSLAPSVRAAASMFGLTCSNAPRVVRYIKGNATTAAAITVAGQEKATVIPICRAPGPRRCGVQTGGAGRSQPRSAAIPAAESADRPAGLVHVHDIGSWPGPPQCPTRT